MNLAGMKCQACRADSPRATEVETSEYLTQLPEWSIIQQGGVDRLQRIFKFKNFEEALGFTNRVGAVAEAEQHHPLIITEWGRVTVQWWTHAIGGLHINDFVLAAKTDEIR
ncbi:MAG TPA: 4a-hydroxytetrahydrobiopterin dehydratase [Longimicrobiales bacterium]